MIRFPTKAESCLFVNVSRLTRHLAKPPTQRVQEAVCPGIDQSGSESKHSLARTVRSVVCEALSPIPQVLMVWYLIKNRDFVLTQTEVP